MSTNVLKADCSVADAWVAKDLSLAAPWEVHFDLFIPAATFTALASRQFSATFLNAEGSSNSDGPFLTGYDTSGGAHDFSSGNRNWWTTWATTNPSNTGSPFAADTWFRSVVVAYDGSDNITFSFAGSTLFTYNEITAGSTTLDPLLTIQIGGFAASHIASEIYYLDNVQVYDGSSTLVFSDDFGTGDLSKWDATSGSVSVISDPTSGEDTSPPPPPPVIGRVLVAWDDPPLEPDPTWTALDQGGDFPQGFVAGYDTQNGRQTLLSQTDTGTATVYINDREGLFDNRNDSSPYQGKLSGRQIMLQLYDPVAEAWEPQFRGLINDWNYDIDGSATDANGDPINASIQIECVDVFDYLNGFGLTPGLAGVLPTPAGMEDGVYYAATSGTVDDRLIEIATDVGLDPAMYHFASGNVKVMAVKYDPDESALTAMRDATDAELPFIGMLYCDRRGRLNFRGRYSRFDPDFVAAEPGSTWDFTRWAVGDEKAIQTDPTRAQMRVLSYSRDRNDLINAAICYPQGLPASQMPNQVYANTPSITAYGKHSAPPMSDLLTSQGTVTGNTGAEECALYAELLVRNKKDPRVAITSLQVKAIPPTDYRAAQTWAFITRSDISHIVNAKVGYPGGTGFEGTSPEDDYFIEGRRLTVRPLNPIHDDVTYELEVSPAVWSMDTHGIFPVADSQAPPILTAAFSVAE